MSSSAVASASTQRKAPTALTAQEEKLLAKYKALAQTKSTGSVAEQKQSAADARARAAAILAAEGGIQARSFSTKRQSGLKQAASSSKRSQADSSAGAGDDDDDDSDDDDDDDAAAADNDRGARAAGASALATLAAAAADVSGRPRRGQRRAGLGARAAAAETGGERAGDARSGSDAMDVTGSSGGSAPARGAAAAAAAAPQFVRGQSLASGGGDRGDPKVRTIFVGAIAPHIDEPLLRSVFGYYGVIEHVYIVPQSNYGFIRFADAASVKRATAEMNGRSVEGCTLRVSAARRGGHSSHGGVAHSDAAAQGATPAQAAQPTHVHTGDVASSGAAADTQAAVANAWTEASAAAAASGAPGTVPGVAVPPGAVAGLSMDGSFPATPQYAESTRRRQMVVYDGFDT